MLTYFVSIYFRALKNDMKLKNTVRGKLLTGISCSLVIFVVKTIWQFFGINLVLISPF